MARTPFLLTTPRLTLREFVEEDADAMFDLCRDSAVMAFVGPPPESAEEERRTIERHQQRYQNPGYSLWALRVKGSKNIIGRCGLMDLDVEGEPATEVSYLLARDHWGLGYAAEAASAVLEVARDRFHLPRVVALIHPDNIASIRVAERIGLEYERDVWEERFGVIRQYTTTR
jgi:RimJ/RimL family protein N-acetyltransferase